MTLTWTAPGALWLLAAIPLVWVAVRFGRTNFNRRQRVLQAVIRSLLLAALALALARPVMSVSSSRLSVVYVVDVSHSVSTRAIEGAADRIDSLNASLRPDHFRVVAFGGASQVLDTTQALREAAKVDVAQSASDPLRRDVSDVEQALHQARAELQPGHVPRLVVFSDGRETAGDAVDAAAQLAAVGIPVFVEPMDARDLGDTWVEGVAAPDRVTAGALTTMVVEVGSQRSGQAVVELRAGDQVLGRESAAVEPGVTPVPLDVTFPDAGAVRVDAIVAAPDDPLATNNRLSAEVVVGARTAVLYVEGAPASARYLRGALEASGFAVTVGQAAALPTTSAGLDPWDVVILSDLARASISDAAMAAIAEWVERDGGGLLVAGGEAVFGEAPEGTGPQGYRHSELERLTPVTFERKDEPEVALVIILDKSWSMAGAVMELCKAAAQAAIDVLSDEQSVGVITFNDGFNWDVTLRNVGEHRPAIRKAVAAIEPSGHTLIFPAIEQAYQALRDVPARAKHVVLLSDGRSYPDDYEALIKRMVDAKMTVSSISVGPAADQELLRNIARWGRGRSYMVEDAKEVPQIFVKEAKDAANPAFDEKALTPTVKVRGFLEGVDLSRAPRLRGRTAVVVKDDATEMVTTEDGDPLLAFWPIGLGRSAVFASDVKDRWASDWLKWRGYGPFFSSIVRALARQRPAGVGVHVVPGVTRGSARPVTVVVEARDPHGNYLDRLRPAVTIRDGGGREASQTARQVAPGRYEARVVTDAAQPLEIQVEGPAGVRTTRLVVPDPFAEYRFRAADHARLAAMAEATGGGVSGTADVIAAAGAQAARRALWPFLVLAALGLWLIDILFRRVRVFEPA